jgi:hypothetical protein
MAQIIEFPKRGAGDPTSAERRFAAAHGYSQSAGLMLTAAMWSEITDLLIRGCPPRQAVALAARHVPLGESWAFRDHRSMSEVIATEEAL